MKAKHIPNILSVVRIMLVPVFACLFMGGKYLPALGVFVLAGLTDVADGSLARHFNWITDVGKLLDPVADKLMQCVALICLCAKGFAPVWLLIFFLIKEGMMILGATLLYKRRNVVVYSGWLGKTAVTVFYLAIFSLVLFREPLTALPALRAGICAFTVLMAFLAITKYYLDFVRNKNIKGSTSPSDVGETLR